MALVHLGQVLDGVRLHEQSTGVSCHLRPGDADQRAAALLDPYLLPPWKYAMDEERLDGARHHRQAGMRMMMSRLEQRS
eukprot:746332-Hanusia_phi.AAC.25